MASRRPPGARNWGSPSFRFVPNQFTDIKFRAEAKKGPLITFYCGYDNDERIEKLPIHQALFFKDSVSKVPQLLFDPDDDEGSYDFRELIGAESRRDVEAEWEAFAAFKSWLEDGVYLNRQILCTHIDAYLLAEKLESPGFKNAVMREMLKMMPARKYDADLKETYRTIFTSCPMSSRLRKLYFESASFWKFSFDKDGYVGGSNGELGLDSTSEKWLMLSLREHRERFCHCPLIGAPPAPRLRENRYPPPPECRDEEEEKLWCSQQHRPPSQIPTPLPTLRHRPRPICNCEKAPWEDPERFYVAG
ncbi:uncharacterized protein K444DRAFT_723399 [Hyaloscypha bicolor E]|uniref:BTB domain-containing protein n=1 Tax=Hyaloscypha bicolor E TaxID=1095630 RepID=A0A2J6T9H2_9HELO|nr:uncharacterized protein K444DRAFT_723399 [Hyaloscypha bicolor E]PMD59676.1 hypothetical protein K444DRAFT_723399 [Hyaloscypha bicolor E]